MVLHRPGCWQLGSLPLYCTLEDSLNQNALIESESLAQTGCSFTRCWSSFLGSELPKRGKGQLRAASPASSSIHRSACPLVPSSAGMLHLWDPQEGCPGLTGQSSIFVATFGHTMKPETHGAISLSLCICAASSHGMMVHPRAANAYWRAKSDE